jgi:hypothetical protein
MSLRDYAVPRDRFVSDKKLQNDFMGFPCLCCLYRAAGWSEHPCNICGHNKVESEKEVSK